MFGGIGGIQHSWFVADVLLSQWVGLRETPGLQLHGFLQGLDGFLARKTCSKQHLERWGSGDWISRGKASYEWFPT